MRLAFTLAQYTYLKCVLLTEAGTVPRHPRYEDSVFLTDLSKDICFKRNYFLKIVLYTFAHEIYFTFYTETYITV